MTPPGLEGSPATDGEHTAFDDSRGEPLTTLSEAGPPTADFQGLPQDPCTSCTKAALTVEKALHLLEAGDPDGARAVLQAFLAQFGGEPPAPTKGDPA